MDHTFAHRCRGVGHDADDRVVAARHFLNACHRQTGGHGAQHEPLGALGKDEPQRLQHGFHHLGLHRQKDQVAVPGDLGVGGCLTAQFCGQCFSLGRRAVRQKYILRLGSLAHSACNSTAHVSTA